MTERSLSSKQTQKTNLRLTKGAAGGGGGGRARDGHTRASTYKPTNRDLLHSPGNAQHPVITCNGTEWAEEQMHVCNSISGLYT